MAMTRSLNSREKAFLILTVIVAVGLLVYYGFLSGFIEDYTSTSADIAKIEGDLAAQRKVLSQKAEIDARYDKIKETMIQGDEGKSPAAAFTEELRALIGAVTISSAQFEPVPEAPGFAFVVLSFGPMQGNLASITEILKGLHERNLLVDDLTIKMSGGGRVTANPMLDLQVTKVKQLVREEHLDAPARAAVQKARGVVKARSKTTPTSGAPRVLAPDE